LLFNREGDCLAAKLRPGNVHGAEDWDELLLPEIEREQKLGKEVVFRADAAFAKPEVRGAGAAWSLTSLQQRLVKTGGRLVKHARYCWLLLAENHLPRRLFGAMVRRTAALSVATG
jgi:hypothetical protein